MVRVPPCHGGGQGFEPLSGRLLNNFQLQLNIWGLSSAGRASALQAEGHRFEPYRPHFFNLICRSGGTGRRPGLKIPWVVIPVPVRFRSAALFYSKFLLDLEYFFILYQICTDFSHQKTVPVQEPFRIKPTPFSYFLFFLILFILNTNSLDCYTSSSYYFDIFKVL